MTQNKHQHETCNHNHDHNHDHGSCGHNHSKNAVWIFLAGVLAFGIALFVPQKLIANGLFLASIILSGEHVITEGFLDTINSTKKNRKFTPNIHLLMTLAALGAIIIGDFQEAALLILIFAGAHFLEDYVEGKSKRDITNLLNLNPTQARRINDDGTVEVIDASMIKVGDLLQVLNGDQVPTDGVIISGYSSINEASITGESIPSEKSKGDSVFGSTLNGDGTFTMKVTKDSSETVYAKIVQLVNASQDNLTPAASKIKKLEPSYVSLVLILVPIFIILGPTIFSWTWSESFYRGMVFLTVASPCALAASAVPATLAAISNLARQGVLFKGGTYLSMLNDIKVIAFDKTGTLTAGKPVVTDAYFINEDRRQEFLDIIVAMEKATNHPLANAIITHFNVSTVMDIDVNTVVGHGLNADYEGHHYQIGKPDMFESVDKSIQENKEKLAHDGKTIVYFAEDGVVQGYIALLDVPNAASKDVVDALKKLGIHTVMITGDSKQTGEAIGRLVGVDEVRGNVLPEQKAELVEALRREHGPIVMIGDGINDAPALVKADVGIAMGQGTDIAIDVADAVLMRNDLNNLVKAIKQSKRLDRIVWENIFFSMFVVVVLVIMNIMGTMDLPLGVVMHEGSTIVVLLNGLRLLKSPK